MMPSRRPPRDPDPQVLTITRSQFGRSVARSGPHQRERRSWPSQWEVREWLTAGRCRVWHDCAPPHSTAASFDHREAFGPLVLVECVQGDVEAIRFVAESGQRPGRVDSGLGGGIAGADAQKFRISTSLLVAQGASVIVGVLDTLARRACEICQSKKTSVIGRSAHGTVHPEIMSGDMDSGQVTFLTRLARAGLARASYGASPLAARTGGYRPGLSHLGFRGIRLIAELAHLHCRAFPGVTRRWP